jgi:ABC-type Fe3+-hydroxamate transport system substrate-binding protein
MEINMKILVALLMMLALITTSGCWNTNESRQGGIAPVNEEFSITVPASSTVKQGAEATVIVSLNRGAYFKQDVLLALKAEGISVSPNSVLIRASDKPEAAIKVMTNKDTALGEYRVTVKGTPSTGLPASTVFIIEVVAL